MSNLNAGYKVIVLTVGAGKEGQLESSLYVPLRKSIGTDCWDRIILLPSQHTVEYANEIKNQFPGLPVNICPIPDAESENDADASFAHFDRILGELIDSDGVDPQDITLDFTRGTKAMSAALVLAGVSRRISKLRYIEGVRGPHGNVIPGKEQIRQVRADVASARQQINLAEQLMLRGDFAAVNTICQRIHLALEKLPERLLARLKAYAHVAAIYAAWDRFDYRQAHDLLVKHREIVSEAGKFKPTLDMEEWIDRLANHPNRDKHKEIAAYLRCLSCDLLANAERRYRDGLFEDAGVRWYRLLELIGQARLFDKGYDSGALPKDDLNVKGFNDKLKEGGSAQLSHSKKDMLCSDRFQTARFLKFLGDKDFASRLLDNIDDYVRARNNGLLAHGFFALSSKMEKERICSIIKNFEELLCEEISQAHEWLKVARSLDFSKSE